MFKLLINANTYKPTICIDYWSFDTILWKTYKGPVIFTLLHVEVIFPPNIFSGYYLNVVIQTQHLGIGVFSSERISDMID